MTSLVTALFRRAHNFIQLSQNLSTLHRTFVQFSPSISAVGESNRLSLKPKLPLISQVCGFKVKLKLRKRCKDCYFVVREQRMYVICPTHPRHKQMSMVKKPKYTWVITHACQSKVRPW